MVSTYNWAYNLTCNCPSVLGLPVYESTPSIPTLENSGVDRIRSLNDPEYVPYIIQILSTSGF